MHDYVSIMQPLSDLHNRVFLIVVTIILSGYNVSEKAVSCQPSAVSFFFKLMSNGNTEGMADR
jgi:hypothetical protein